MLNDHGAKEYNILHESISIELHCIIENNT